jgi:hypothetical protein
VGGRESGRKREGEKRVGEREGRRKSEWDEEEEEGERVEVREWGVRERGGKDWWGRESGMKREWEKDGTGAREYMEGRIIGERKRERGQVRTDDGGRVAVHGHPPVLQGGARAHRPVWQHQKIKGLCPVLAYFIGRKLPDVSFSFNFFAARNSLRFKYLIGNEFKLGSKASVGSNEVNVEYILDKQKSSSIYPTLTQTYSHMLFRRYFDEI